MTYETLMALIQEYGEDKIVGFIFDNAGRIFFGNDVNSTFRIKEHIDQTTNCLVFVQEDSKGTPYLSFKPISVIQSICVALEGNFPNHYDHYSMQ